MLSFDFYVFSARTIAWRDPARESTAFTGPEHYFNISEAKRCKLKISIPKPVS